MIMPTKETSSASFFTYARLSVERGGVEFPPDGGFFYERQQPQLAHLLFVEQGPFKDVGSKVHGRLLPL